MDMSKIVKFMIDNRNSYDSAFDCAVDCTSHYSLWEDNEDMCGGEWEIPQIVVEAAERVFGEQG